MSVTSDLILKEYDRLQGGQVALLLYRLMNLCLKAEAAALLAVEIVTDGDKVNLEDVANVFNPQEDQYCIIPQDESFLFPISKGLVKLHPEFKIELKLLSDEGLEDFSADEDSESSSKMKVILATVPKVDKNRHDILIDAVDVLYNDCKSRLEQYKADYLARLTNSLEGHSAEDADEMRKQFDETTDQYSEMRDKMRDEKKDEIEKAYEMYKANQEEISTNQKEEQMAKGRDKMLSMNMFDTEN